MRRCIWNLARTRPDSTSRLHDIVIHASPAATKQVTRRPPTPILDLPATTAALLERTVHSDRQDILDELESRRPRALTEVSAAEYSKLQDDLARSFLAGQLRDYLTHLGLKPLPSLRKRGIIELILQTWQIRIRADKDVVQATTIPTTNRDLFFMLGGDGQMMRTWARQCSATVDIDAYTSTLTITATAANTDRFKRRMAQALTSVKSALIIDPLIRYNDTHGREIMTVVKAFIEPQGNDIRVSWLGERDDAFNEARRFIYESLRNPITPDITTLKCDQPVQQRIIDRQLPFFQRRQTWTRLVDDRPPNSARPRLTPQDLTIDTRKVHVGHVLHNERYIFSGNVAGLYTLLKTLTPASNPQRNIMRLTFRSARHRLDIDIGESVRSNIVHERAPSLLRMPQHTIDLMSTSDVLEPVEDDRVQAFLETCQLDPTAAKLKVSPILQLDEEYRFSSLRVIDTLIFQLSSGTVQWSTIQGGVMNGRTNDLCIATTDQYELCSLLNRLNNTTLGV